jgi:hypothetical protein
MPQVELDELRLSVRIASMAVAAAFLIVAMLAGHRYIGWPPVIIQVHLIEEYLTGFAPAMSRLFNISWTVNSYLMIFVLVGPVLYTLTALGLFRRVPLAGFLMCFIFIGPGVAEFTHFIFPILQPDVLPNVAAPVDAIVGRGQLSCRTSRTSGCTLRGAITFPACTPRYCR